MMGYWGEAMAHNHPLWSEQDIAAARIIVAKLKETPKLTDRERAYLNAVKLLYGDGDKRARELAYSAAMEKIYRAYPNDLDAASFYSFSLLGPDQKRRQRLSFAGSSRRDRTRRLRKEPEPSGRGSLHHSRLRRSGSRDSRITRGAPLCRHRTRSASRAAHAVAHFSPVRNVAEAAASNESAWESSDNWMKRKKLSLSVRDYHSLHWLLYAYLQQGRYKKGGRVVAVDEESDVGIDLRQQAAAGLLRKQLGHHGCGFYRRDRALGPSKRAVSRKPNRQPATEQTPPPVALTECTVRPLPGQYGSNTTRESNLPPFIRDLSAAVRGSYNATAEPTGSESFKLRQ